MRVLQQMRQLVRTSRYVMTSHGLDEMEADRLNAFDIERCILTGHIVERQRDRDSGEWKYLVAGRTLTDDPVVVVVKISATGKLVFITVFLA